MDLSHQQQVIHWQAAHQAVLAAVRHAKSLRVDIAAAVVDAGGNLVAFLRAENGPYLSVDIAIDKAYTAASFGVPTSRWDELLPQGTMLREGIVNRDRFVPFGGGLPILVNKKCLGAIGVSGGSEEQDMACAAAGLAAVV